MTEATDMSMICVICGTHISPDGTPLSRPRNAQPLADGDCCAHCDVYAVTPARLAEYGYPETTIAEVIEMERRANNLD